MQQMVADVDVVIIGAGAAGIAAARQLAASHLSAIVLEATARVGGRAWTCEVAGMRLDLGCGWLIPPTATRGPALPRRPASRSIVALLRGVSSIRGINGSDIRGQATFIAGLFGIAA